MLKKYKQYIEDKIDENLFLFGPRNDLRDACRYALMNGGKRFRPALVLMIANALGKGFDATLAALSIEFFHTASLVADDLPCMDNDDERRNKPSLHKVYGEAMTLLVSYGLIAAGYDCLCKNAALLKLGQTTAVSSLDRICVLAVENVSHNMGLLGATGGQYLDICPPNASEATLRDIIHKKTVSLFEVAFVLGWLFGGGDIHQLETVKAAASHFGMAFQIADDLGDIEQDTKNKSKSNMALIFGAAKAIEMFHIEMDLYRTTMYNLGLATEELKNIEAFLMQQFESFLLKINQKRMPEV